MEDGKSDGHTIVLFVLCNDIFAWGCADAEDLSLDEVEGVYKMWIKDKIWGPTKWSCLKRKEKPQDPVQKHMKRDGSWDEAMEALPENHYDAILKEEYDKKNPK